MATKIYCDGCDADITARALHKDCMFGAELKLQRNGHSAIHIEHLDLCADCIGRLKRETNPREWTRNLSGRQA